LNGIHYDSGWRRPNFDCAGSVGLRQEKPSGAAAQDVPLGFTRQISINDTTVNTFMRFNTDLLDSGHWIVYASTDSGRSEIHVQDFQPAPRGGRRSGDLNGSKQ
jgi:hypothetical protein